MTSYANFVQLQWDKTSRTVSTSRREWLLVTLLSEQLLELLDSELEREILNGYAVVEFYYQALCNAHGIQRVTSASYGRGQHQVTVLKLLKAFRPILTWHRKSVISQEVPLRNELSDVMQHFDRQFIKALLSIGITPKYLENTIFTTVRTYDKI